MTVTVIGGGSITIPAGNGVNINDPGTTVNNSNSFSSTAERSTAAAITAGVTSSVAPDTNWVSDYVNQYVIINPFSSTAELAQITATTTIAPVINATFDNSHSSGVPILLVADLILNAKAFGAVGDNSTDDTTAVGNVIDAAAAVNGTAYFPDGTYLLTTWSEKTITSQFKIKGSGTIKGPNTTTNFIKANADVYFEGVIFNTWDYSSNLSGSTGARRVGMLDVDFVSAGVAEWIDTAGVSASNYVDFFVMERCTVDTATIPINIEHPYERVIVSNSNFDTITTGAIRLGKNVYANQIYWNNAEIIGCRCTNVTATSTNNAFFVLIYGNEARITSNTVKGVTSDSGECWGIYTKNKRAVIMGNNLSDLTSTSGPIYIIDCKGNIRGDTSTPQGYATEVIGNTIKNDDTGVGIRLASSDSMAALNHVEDCEIGATCSLNGADSNSICNNKFYSCSSDTIVINTGGDNVTCTGNVVINGGDAGIKITSDTTVSNYVINNNLITNATGFGIEFGDTQIKNNVTIQGNVCDTAARFLNLQGVNEAVISGNVLDNITNANDPIQILTANTNVTIEEDFTKSITGASATTARLYRVTSSGAVVIKAEISAMKDDQTTGAYWETASIWYNNASTPTQIGSTTAGITINPSSWTGPSFTGSSVYVAFQIGIAASTTGDCRIKTTVRIP